MTEKEKNSLEYLKVRLYGNKGCKFIDVAQEDLRRIIKLIDTKEKSLKQSNELIAEQDDYIIKLNNKISDLEFKVEQFTDKIEYYDDLFSALEDYYSITQEDIEKCIKEDK